MEVEKLHYSITDDFDTVKRQVIENKDKYKGKELSDCLVIKGVGDKYLKIENNFFSWNEIRDALNDYKVGKKINEIILSILSWLFIDVTGIENTYKPRKFNLNENFQKIKQEILNHKEYYKRELISGIGKDNIKITTYKKKDYYIEWDEIETAVNNIKYSSFDDLEDKRFNTSIIKQLFNDNDIQYTDEESELLDEKEGKLKLKYYKIFKNGKLSYKLIKTDNDNIETVKDLVILALKWNNGQLPLNINEDGVNHVILSKSSPIRADLKINDNYTKMIQKDLGDNFKVYSIQYSDEYIYHTHFYKKLIKFEKDSGKWTVTYNNKKLLQNAFRKEINNHWNCDINITKSTEVCVINDYENEDNPFNPDLFSKLYDKFNRKT